MSGKIFKLLFFSVLIFIFTSCRIKINNTEPYLLPSLDAEVIKKDYSILSIPIDIPIGSIEKIINKHITGLLFEDNCYDTPIKDDIMLKIWKIRDIRIQSHENFLRFEIPLRIWAKYRWKACDFCPQIEKETSFNILISLTSNISFNPDWSVKSQTIPTGFQFESTPKIEFGPISIPITKLVEPIVSEQLIETSKEIDIDIASVLDFKETIDSIWKELHKPQIINSELNAWLKISPKEVLMAPIRGNNNQIRIVVSIKGIIEVLFSDYIEYRKPSPLPSLNISELIDRDFNIFIESFFCFEKATDLARKHLNDTVIIITPKHSIKIEDIILMGYEKKVYTKVYLGQSVKGSVFFEGAPAYNREEGILYFKDFDYHFKTKNVLLKSANWILHGPLKNRIEQELRYPLVNDINETRIIVSQFIENYSFEDLFTLRGKLSNLDIYNISVEERGLRIIINAQGRAQIKINNLNF